MEIHNKNYRFVDINKMWFNHIVDINKMVEKKKMKEKIRNQEGYKQELQINSVVKKIEKMAKTHGKEITRFACQRWANKIREQSRLEKEIKEKEQELQHLKKTKI